MIFDSHCHLDPQIYGGMAGVDAVIRTARAAGVSRMLTVGAGYGDGSAHRAVQVANTHDQVWASVGMHPHDASQLTPSVLQDLIALAAQDCVVAWGEIGLDFFYDNSPRGVQRDAMRRQIQVALQLSLPIIVHDRDSDGECMKILDQEGGFEGAVLYHCYAGGVDELEPLIQRGAMISIPGTVTYKRSTELREATRLAPIDRLLVETDAPFLTPEPLRGRRNEPSHVALTVDTVASLRGMSRGELCAQTTRNACRLFGVQ